MKANLCFCSPISCRRIGCDPWATTIAKYTNNVQRQHTAKHYLSPSGEHIWNCTVSNDKLIRRKMPGNWKNSRILGDLTALASHLQTQSAPATASQKVAQKSSNSPEASKSSDSSATIKQSSLSPKKSASEMQFPSPISPKTPSPSISWMGSIWGCFKPFLEVMGKTPAAPLSNFITLADKEKGKSFIHFVSFSIEVLIRN